MSRKPACKYGQKCFRKNETHLKNYDHNSTELNEAKENLSDNSKPSKKIKLDYSEESVELKQDDKASEKINQEFKNVEKHDIIQVIDLKKFIKEINEMEMPEDFFELLEFCNSLNKNDPKNALNSASLELTGIYDLALFGFKLDYKLHSRYFYDPPEFQTVLRVKNSENQLHFGYFRDDPDELPDFVGINEPKLDCKIHVKGDNIFSAINWYLDELISGKNYKSESSINEIKILKIELNEWCDKHFKNNKSFSLNLKTPKIKAREKKINCKTFHTAGLFVPVDSKGFGYREVPETYENQKKIFTNYSLTDTDPKNKEKKLKADERIQEIITLIQFANDETDYGMGLEFGLNLFSYGDLSMHKFIKSVLPVCYDLLGRSLYSQIIKEHLKNRKFTI